RQTKNPKQQSNKTLRKLGKTNHKTGSLVIFPRSAIGFQHLRRHMPSTVSRESDRLNRNFPASRYTGVAAGRGERDRSVHGRFAEWSTRHKKRRISAAFFIESFGVSPGPIQASSPGGLVVSDVRHVDSPAALVVVSAHLMHVVSPEAEDTFGRNDMHKQTSHSAAAESHSVWTRCGSPILVGTWVLAG
ncbi:hypothetical protein, partial [Neomesorhizobium albiziae]|uniref:hypothetical protein n=1 Tax=Neomesorhizobium albiziae TaxID=335020 RepID=UPI0024E144B2